MKLNVYSLFDRAALTYGHPFYALNDAVAIRNFRDAVLRRESSMLRDHPDDFELRHIASFDDEKGSFEPALCLTLDTARAALQFWAHEAKIDPKEIEGEALALDSKKLVAAVENRFFNQDNKGVNDD